MAIGLRSFVVVARDDFGSMMKWVMDHFESTVPVKSTSLKRDKSGKKSAGAHSTRPNQYHHHPYFASVCPL